MYSKSIIAASLMFSLNAMANQEKLVFNHDVNKFSDSTEFNPIMDAQVNFHKEKNLETIKPMVIGGWDANPDTYNFHARLVKTTGGYISDTCGSSIINDSFVLTAAHCVFDTDTMEYTATAEDLGIIVKNFSYSDVYSEEVKSVKAIHIHPSYGRDGIFVDDIAVLELASPIVDNVSSMPLATMSDKAEYDLVTEGKIVGLGYINDNRNTPEFLQENNVEILSQEACETLTYNEHDEVICIQSNEKGLDNKGQVCQGDSGGIMGYTKPNGDFQQIGVTSYGYFSCEAAMYGVFAEIAYYTAWIESVANYGNELTFNPNADNNDYHSFGDNGFDYGEYVSNQPTNPEEPSTGSGGSGGSTGLLTLFGLVLFTLRRKNQ